MNLNKKKSLAKRVFGVGEKRITFVDSRLEDIKEAITKQDMRDLKEDGAILINNVNGRKKNLKKKAKRSVGNVRKKVKKKKRTYVLATRKLRKYTKGVKEQGNITKEDSDDIRKKIRNRVFRSKAHLRDHIGGLKK
ncbi:MAG: hypothetical protein KKC19_01380 [Nanoarchaeota archaeon]|nr:hypothetical protein [Nanoarchaeota archaeon]